jgi:hypothetical protein
MLKSSCRKINKMKNLNSKNSELFEGKKEFDYSTHYRMPKVKLTNKRRRRTAFKGIVNQGQLKTKN